MSVSGAVFAVKGALTAMTDERVRTAVLSVTAAICIPFFLIISVMLCSLSGTADHNRQAVLDRKTGRVSILPGREDSLDRMMEAGLFPDRGEQDIEAEICSRLQYEKLHRAIRQLEKREQYLIIQLFFCGRSERELAGELCVSQNAINKQRGRILQKLRKILQNLSF